MILRTSCYIKLDGLLINESTSEGLTEPQIIFDTSPTSSAPIKPPMTLTEHVVSTPSPTLLNQGSVNGCKCLCHEVRRLSTPIFLREIFGILQIEKYGHFCSSPTCRQHSFRKSRRFAMKIDYDFPSWLLSRAISASCHAMNTGYSYSLRVPRACPFDAAIFRAIQNSEGTPSIRELLLRGEASIHDVDPEGNTPLHVRPSSNIYADQPK